MEGYAEKSAHTAENPATSADQLSTSRSRVRLALAQLNFTVGAFEQNFAKITTAVARASTEDADHVVFSEMATTGYPPRDLLNHARFIDLNLALLDRVAALSTSRIDILIGFVDRNPAAEGKALCNAAALCHNGRIVGRYYKALLPTYDVFDEDRYFELPGAEEAHGQVRRFQLAPRLTEHVRHRTKYLDMPVLDSQAFVFTGNGRPGTRARTLKEFTGLLATLPADRLAGHLRRHDFSNWIEGVFRDRPLAAHLREVEARVQTDDPREVADAIGQAIRARYKTAVTEHVSEL
jgi:hypothetical protein